LTHRTLKINILLLFFLLSPLLYGQGETDQQLAQLYYSKGEFVKALGYYEKLYAADPSKFYFNRYLDCLIATDQRKDAEKLLKKQAAANRFDSEYKVRLGQFYEDEEGEKSDKAQKIYSELIDQLVPDAGQIIQLYNAFKGKGRNDLALRTLETGRKLLKETYPLHFQFAELYGAMGQTEKMIDEYLDLLDFYSSYYQTLQTVLTTQFDLSAKESKEYDLLKNALLERVQKKPNDTVYAEMLIWLFLQRKNFNAALTQAQALDKRQVEQGLRVIDVAKICVENRDYETARKGFKYVLSLGEEKSYYYEAERALLNTRFLEVTTNRNFSTEELNQTIQEYRTTLERIGQKRSGVPLIIELSHILAFYANQATEAIEMLTKVSSIQGLTDMQKAEIKMELGDIQVLHGDIWEASLLYMQIENTFKFEPIGNEAKYKNARIFYYDGEFDFAQSQLNVLKESTSKLIANDAMQLSLLITDNFGLDSNYQAMTWFANADLLIEQHQYSQAFALFDSIIKNYPYHSLGDEILLRKSKAMKQQGQWTEAVRYLEELLKYHREDILADDAIFQLGELHELHVNNLEKAAEYYKTLLFDFKGSLYAEEARKRFRALRGDVPDEDEAQ
jgi:tetratricopeptide (TPR) repeat protein